MTAIKAVSIALDGASTCLGTSDILLEEGSGGLLERVHEHRQWRRGISQAQKLGDKEQIMCPSMREINGSHVAGVFYSVVEF